MTKTNKKCNDNCACSHADGKIAATDCGFTEADKHTGAKETLDYGFYSNVLKKPFERLDDLKKAEYVYFEKQKAKEDAAAKKKADATKVEDAFKALNAARKSYKEDLCQLTKEYSEELETLKKAFELGKKDIHDKLAAAEETYEVALKEFTNKYPEGFHLTLKDGDFETTIDSKATAGSNDVVDNFFRILFGI